MPESIVLADAAAIPEVFLTAWDALVVQGGLTSGRWALVHAGASGVGTAAIQIAIVYWAPLQRLLHTEALSVADLGIVLLVSTGVFWVVELEKWIRRRSGSTVI